MIDNVDTEVEQVFAVFLLRGDEGADVQFQLVEHGFVHNTVAVDEMAEEAVFLDGGKILYSSYLMYKRIICENQCNLW